MQEKVEGFSDVPGDEASFWFHDTKGFLFEPRFILNKNVTSHDSQKLKERF